MNKELIKKTDRDLAKTLADKQTALRDFYFGVAGGKVTDVKAARNLRKDIAKIMTILGDRRRSKI